MAVPFSVIIIVVEGVFVSDLAGSIGGHFFIIETVPETHPQVERLVSVMPPSS